MLPETDDYSRELASKLAPPRPGVVLVFSGATTLFHPFGVGVGDATFEIGRAGPVGAVVNDDRISRRHAEVSRTEEGWRVRDLGSRNGTFIDGVQVHGEVVVPSLRVIRAGDTILVANEDILKVSFPAEQGPIIGSHLHAAFKDVDRAATMSETLLVLGESGTGKELAAQRFHQKGPHARGPFVAVNCAAIPPGLAESLLFGARRGAYSGASADTIGHVQSAHGGVLFLDEAGELDLQLQAKLLRVLETREVIPLGASHGERVSTRICLATHRDLRSAVAEGRFRGDLYHRIAPPEVRLPLLRDRLDEITQHVAAAIALVSSELRAHAKLVEACLLRQWPGNVRELRKHVQEAASRAVSEGSTRVDLTHLSPIAGQPIESKLTPKPAEVAAPGASAEAPAVPAGKGRRDYVRWSQSLTRETLERVLAEHEGNVSNVAKSLGMGRPQVYREMARFGLRRASSAERESESPSEATDTDSDAGAK